VKSGAENDTHPDLHSDPRTRNLVDGGAGVNDTILLTTVGDRNIGLPRGTADQTTFLFGTPKRMVATHL
jgi:hypothetical protein